MKCFEFTVLYLNVSSWSKLYFADSLDGAVVLITVLNMQIKFYMYWYVLSGKHVFVLH